jgi:hypothetical protein
VAGKIVVVGKDLVDVLAAREHPVPPLPGRPEHLRHVGFVQALEGEVKILPGASGVVYVEVEDEVRRHVRRYRADAARSRRSSHGSSNDQKSECRSLI